MLADLKNQVQMLKEILSGDDFAIVNIFGDWDTTIERDEYEELCSQIWTDMMIPIDRVIKKAGLNKDQIHEVVMIGGSSRIPIVRKMITEHFHSDILNFEENPDECVAEGASFLAFMIANPDNPLCTQLTFESLDDEDS